MIWRDMIAADLPAVERIGAAVHPDHPEDAAVFAERLRLYPEGCLALCEGREILGYAVSHPWHDGSSPALNTLLGALPESPSCLFVHDLALLPAARRQGAGARGMRRLMAQAGGCPVCLVAVGRSRPFWESLGFAVAENAGLTDKLRSYGAGACYMRHAPVPPR
ncbi:MAG TPA: GNAT family N-acetyltransferase [Acetobacteraceae bacterium]